MIWKSTLNQRLAQAGDYFTILFSIILSGFVFEGSFTKESYLSNTVEKYFSYEITIITFLCPLFFVYLFTYFRAYNYQRFTSLLTEAAIVFKVVLIGSLGTIAFLYLLKFNNIPRSFLVVSLLTILFCLLSEKIVMFYLARIIRKQQPPKRIMLVGHLQSLISLQKIFNNNKTWGIQIIGATIPDEENSTYNRGLNILGNFDNIIEILKEHNPEEVIISFESNELSKIKYISEECEKVGIQIRLISDFFSHMAKNISVDNVQGISIISLYPYHRTNLEKLIKRLIDFFISAIALIILSPFFLVISCLILLQDGKPVFFKWKVMGLNRKPITSWKFRTMYNNADEIKKELMKHNEMKGPMFKMENDPRIFPVGHFLRKFSLDELPQLISVLKGDLSLVGPRPPLQYEFIEFDLWHRRKLSVKPGITCLWQINGRNKINNFDDWVKLDLEYIDNWSLMLDLKILLKTIPAVLRGTGK